MNEQVLQMNLSTKRTSSCVHDTRTRFDDGISSADDCFRIFVSSRVNTKVLTFTLLQCLLK